MEYEYTDVTTQPDLAKIHADVAASAMTDKGIEWCRWDEEAGVLKVKFSAELNAADGEALDGIVAAST